MGDGSGWERKVRVGTAHGSRAVVEASALPAGREVVRSTRPGNDARPSASPSSCARGLLGMGVVLSGTRVNGPECQFPQGSARISSILVSIPPTAQFDPFRIK